MKYSIWIIPSEPLESTLKQVVVRLAKELEGPEFEPHMTLLGDIEGDLTELKEKVKQLASKIDKLELSLGSVSFSTTYFQSVFVRVNSTAELMKLNLEAKKLFGVSNNVFMPHISLLYGDHDMEVREQASLKVNIPEAFFIVKELVVIPATSNPNEWEHLATIPFSG